MKEKEMQGAKVLPLRWMIFIVLVVGSVSSRSQTPIKLAVEQSLPITEFAHAMIMPVKCDAEGDIFFRGSGGRVPSAGALQRLSADGKNLSTINTLAGDFSKSTLSQFDVTPDGTLYAVLTLNRNFLVEFDEKGQIKRHSEISAYGGGIEIQGLGALSADAFLIAGRLIENGNLGRMFTAIINADGKLVREVKIKNDVVVQQQDTANALSGLIVGADDGNAYLLANPAETAQIHVVSASGEVLRTLPVSSPVPKGIASAISVAKGHLVVEFHRENLPEWFKVVNVQTGEEIASYESEVWGTFLCYSLDGFDFFVDDPQTKKFQIVRAVPH
jgi:hypothetical protein